MLWITTTVKNKLAPSARGSEPDSQAAFHCPYLLPPALRGGALPMLPGFQVRAISMSAAAFSANFGMSTMPTRL